MLGGETFVGKHRGQMFVVVFQFIAPTVAPLESDHLIFN